MNYSFDGDSLYLDTFSIILYINFCNIHCLRFIFQYVVDHPSSSKPNLLFQTETWLYDATIADPSLFLSIFSILSFDLNLTFASMYATT